MRQTTIEKFEKFDVINLYEKQNISLNKLSDLVKTKPETISKYLKFKGIKILNRGSLGMNKSGKKFNEFVFDKIDSEEKAYWLGFIFADGYISLKHNVFEISLSAKDKEHLEKFNSFMNYKGNNLKFRLCKKLFPVYRWNIRNLHLVKTLNSLGCKPNKSLILEFPKKSFIKKSLIRHFIRGYFDGDGCISTTFRSINLLGTENMLENIKNYSKIKTKSKLYCKNNSKITKIFQLNSLKALEFLNFIYKDSCIYLERKYNKYLEFCRLYK
jgi:hypothetical protein